MERDNVPVSELASGGQWMLEGYGMKPAPSNPENGAEENAETVFLYRGHNDDRPLIWRQPLNDLVSTINELQSRRRKKLGGVLSKAADMGEDIDEDFDPDAKDNVPGKRDRTSSRGIKLGAGKPDEDDDWDDLGDEQLEEDGDDENMSAERKKEKKRAQEELKAKELELEKIRADIAADDALLRLRRQQAIELGQSASECEESVEQCGTWITALDDVMLKRSTKLADHDKKLGRTKRSIEDSEKDVEDLDLQKLKMDTKHNRDQAEYNNIAKVEAMTSEIWHALDDDIRALHKQVEQEGGERQKEHLRLSKHLQELVVGEQEVAKRLTQQQLFQTDMSKEGKSLHRYWRQKYLVAEMRVGGAVAEVEAEDRARSHLVGHGDRIRAKLEAAQGNLNAQKAIVEDQEGMDAKLKEQTDEVEAKIKQLQLDIDEQEDAKALLERKREDLQADTQDKVEHLNSSLRAIDTSANAVATEQVIAQRTLASSEETLETLEESTARDRLLEDVEALRQSLVHIEKRLVEVQKDRAALRETRAKTQREAMTSTHQIQEEIGVIDKKVEGLLQQRVALEGQLRQLDGQRVVVHGRVKQSAKSITPLEQERKLYEAELDWVREFEEHSFMRMQEKHERKEEEQVKLEDLKNKGADQLKEQKEDEEFVVGALQAFQELKDKVGLHKEHVENKLKTAQYGVDCREAEANSLAATMEALDGKIAEADEASNDVEEKKLNEQADFESKDLDWRGRSKELKQKLKKDQRTLSALEEARKVLQEEVDEVKAQLADQRSAALNAASQATTLRGEKQVFDQLVREATERMEKNQQREELLSEQVVVMRKRFARLATRHRYGGGDASTEP